MGFKPLHDWVLIRRGTPEEKTIGGIIIPDAARSKPTEGIVEAIGPGRYKQEKDKKEKKFVPTVLKPGQQVMFIDYMAKDVTLDGQEITLIREEDILGTIETSNALTTKKPYHVEVKKDRPPMVKAKPEKAAVKTKTQEPEKKEQKTKAAKKTKARK
jgi:chaperonin GroES